ncbi:FAD dependent oxidoreductase [Aspergillus pseudonomiae]|uniref:FAD dependent oxidoreductase n=1 Tax=Aspergillus pseudonomiae TaxID=1506151 RepID=A0A5N7DHR9_9EURO|nr:FAD dependent oxidoreductase [Aspergillus pseudonomiae]KAE8405957.1 FAD dependent oxidoreductase [Aspergillus pseudonomiae]
MQSPALKALLTQDPGLPKPNPTSSYWQTPPHPLSNTQSPSLPGKTDVAIIGSGITGLSVLITLLDDHPDLTITVLEARSLCSGATGRNGGQLAANAGEEYLHLVEEFGREGAGEIVRFTFENLRRMRELVRRFAVEESQVQELVKVRVFLEERGFERFRRSVEALERDLPDFKGVYTVLDREVLKREYHLDGAGGALLPAGTIWPYRLVTEIFACLVEKYGHRLNIETQTPVTSIVSDTTNPSHPYILHTPRGTLRATQIAHCTNGHAGHLLPGLRGPVYPFKGTMTVQDAGNIMINRGGDLSWGFHYPVIYDKESRRYAAGLYYLMQNTKTGYFFFGGEDTRIDHCLSSDDSQVEEGSIRHLQEKLPQFLGYKGAEQWRLAGGWSGIMGFSADGLPVVGRVETSMTGRQGEGEYVAAAFNGYGMANCLLAGEALAKIMMGKDTSACLPKAYGIHETRLKEPLTLDHAIESFELNA